MNKGLVLELREKEREITGYVSVRWKDIIDFAHVLRILSLFYKNVNIEFIHSKLKQVGQRIEDFLENGQNKDNFFNRQERNYLFYQTYGQ